MIPGIRGIEESSVYQEIFAKGLVEGRIEEARQTVVQLGRKKLGEPTEGVRAVIDVIDEVDQLNALLTRILDVSSWDELLGPVDPTA
jgi:hypothetical protein